MKAPSQPLCAQTWEHFRERQQGVVRIMSESKWKLDASGIQALDFPACPADNKEQGQRGMLKICYSAKAGMVDFYLQDLHFSCAVISILYARESIKVKE